MKLRLFVGLLLVARVVSAKSCPPDSAQVGPICVDKYEESVWQLPAQSPSLVSKIVRGRVTAADLLIAGALPVSQADVCDSLVSSFPVSFPSNGQWTAPLYAVSVPKVVPTACITWYQAEQACRLSGKRLLTDQEWQAAASGTPDHAGEPDDFLTTCNTHGSGPRGTGTRSKCVSSWGTFDMGGNLSEWTSDWTEHGPAFFSDCFPLPKAFGNDYSCVADHRSPYINAWVRDGGWSFGEVGGIFTIYSWPLQFGLEFIGFRCAR